MKRRVAVLGAGLGVAMMLTGCASLAPAALQAEDEWSCPEWLTPHKGLDVNFRSHGLPSDVMKPAFGILRVSAPVSDVWANDAGPDSLFFAAIVRCAGTRFSLDHSRVYLDDISADGTLTNRDRRVQGSRSTTDEAKL